ncbi:MAG: NAD(P)/FAD-dependent oxidoreductase [Candidatus Helarchaeota archaeon]
MVYDAVVVGAGPGGSAFGKIATEEGLKVVILERGRYSGEKNTSGSTIWGNIAREIIPDFPADAPIERVVDGSRMYWVPDPGPNWAENSAASKDKSKVDPLNVYRNVFDKWWSEQAVNAGAELKTKTKAVNVIRDGSKIKGVVTEKGEKIEANLVIAADGVNSHIGRMTGLRSKWPPQEVALCIKYDWYFGDENIVLERFGSGIDDGVLIEIYWGATVAGEAGYFWIFPNRESVSLGLGSLMSDYVIHKYNCHWYMWNAIEHPLIAPKLKGGKIREIHAHAIPLTDPNPNTGQINSSYGDGIMMIGDAAGMVCAIDGAGWYGAVKTGKIAANVALKAIEEDDYSANMLKRYEKKWSSGDVGKTLTIGKELETWLVRDMTIDGLAKILASQGVDAMYHPLEFPLGPYIKEAEKGMAGARAIRFAIRPFVDLISQMLK